MTTVLFAFLAASFLTTVPARHGLQNPLIYVMVGTAERIPPTSGVQNGAFTPHTIASKSGRSTLSEL